MNINEEKKKKEKQQKKAFLVKNQTQKALKTLHINT